MKDRSKISNIQAFQKQCLSKIEKIDDLNKQIEKYKRDIHEYVNHLERFGFEYDNGQPKQKKEAPVPPRRMPSAPVASDPEGEL